MLLYYVRHAEPNNPEKKLTPRGERQAEAVGKRLAMHGIDKIYASTAERAILTATPLAEMLNIGIETLDFAHENHTWRELSYVTENDFRTWLFNVPDVKSLFSTDEMFRLGDEWYTHPKFKDYDYKSGIERVKRESEAFLESLGYKHLGRGKYEITEPKYEKVALFAHQGFGIAFLSCILGIPYSQFCPHFDIAHSSVTVIDFVNEGGYAYAKVLTHSNDSHLYREGLPTKYNGGKYI